MGHHTVSAEEWAQATNHNETRRKNNHHFAFPQIHHNSSDDHSHFPRGQYVSSSPSSPSSSPSSSIIILDQSLHYHHHHHRSSSPPIWGRLDMPAETCKSRGCGTDFRSYLSQPYRFRRFSLPARCELLIEHSCQYFTLVFKYGSARRFQGIGVYLKNLKITRMHAYRCRGNTCGALQQLPCFYARE